MTNELIQSKRLMFDSDANHSAQWTIKAILSNEFYEPTERCFVYAAILNDKKIIANAMSEICRCLPMHGLNHLKRVNQTKFLLCSLKKMLVFLHENAEDESVKRIISEFQICTEDNLRQATDELTLSLIKLYMTKCGVSLSVTDLLSEKIEISRVAAHPPILNWQYKDVNCDWPCKFHPNKDFEHLYNGTWFTDKETAYHLKIMEICNFLRTKLKKDVCGIAIDPRIKSIVAVGFDENETHPLMHCAMVLIDAVAKSQKGGAWNELLVNDSDIYSNSNGDTDEYTQFGVSEYIRKMINLKFPSMKFGAERVKSALENRQNYAKIDMNDDNLAKYGPYLCTGYDVYLWREPCTMCSMALTHSRIRTIFFHEIQTMGAVHTLIKLQSFKALNHHFQVFHIS